MSSHQRTRERALMLEEAAQRLIEQHLARRPKRTTTNQIASDADTAPTAEESARDDMIVALVRRLATRDETGAGSGEPG